MQAQLPLTKILFTEWFCLLKIRSQPTQTERNYESLTNKIDLSLQPVFKSHKISEDLKMYEPKPPIISQQCVVYNYQCDLCDAEYVGYTSRHLFQHMIRLLTCKTIYLNLSSFTWRLLHLYVLSSRTVYTVINFSLFTLSHWNVV